MNMGLLRTALVALTSVSIWSSATCEPIWPNEQTDHLEDLLYEQKGFLSVGVAEFVEDCVGLGSEAEGRSFGAEWLRNAYHDMATADVFAGTGGIDASIVYETERPENAGKAFNETSGSFLDLPTRRSSMSDLFAMAAVFAVGACSNGSIIIPFRGGRVDATGPGPAGVPQPQEDLASHTASFARQGFNATEMIALVACGHTIGGVHGSDFPDIVPFVPSNDTLNDQTVGFDTTANFFENRVATEFSSNTTLNPLVSGDNITTRSDERIFNSDGGVMMGKMAASNDFFLSTCSTLLERMLNTVPKSVALTDPIEFYPVKPRLLDVAVELDGKITVSGMIRIEDRQLSSPKDQVRIHLAPRSGEACSDTVPCGLADGLTVDFMSSTCVYNGNCPATFTYYNFTASVPADQGVSSLTVEVINDNTGSSMVHDNGGKGFALVDSFQPVRSLSSRTFVMNSSDFSIPFHFVINLTVAVMNAEQYTDISATFYTLKDPLSPSGGGYLEDTVALIPSQKVEGTNFTYYSLTHEARDFSAFDQPFDLAATGPGGSISSTFFSWDNIEQLLDDVASGN